MLPGPSEKHRNVCWGGKALLSAIAPLHGLEEAQAGAARPPPHPTGAENSLPQGLRLRQDEHRVG